MAIYTGDDGDDLVIPQAAAPPPDPGRFPVYRFKRLIALGGYYRANGRHGDVSAGDSFFGIPWAAIERAELAEVVTVVARVLEDARRHRHTAKHFPVWCATQCGVVIERGPRGMDWRYAFPEKPRKVLDEYEAARLFGLSEAMVRQYRDEMQRALDGEWYWLKTRER